jgi:hypothetical protein
MATSSGASIRFRPADPGAQAATALSAETFQQLPAPMRGAIEAAHDGRDVTVSATAADVETARGMLACPGVFAYRAALIACEIPGSR